MASEAKANAAPMSARWISKVQPAVAAAIAARRKSEREEPHKTCAAPEVTYAAPMIRKLLHLKLHMQLSPILQREATAVVAAASAPAAAATFYVAAAADPSPAASTATAAIPLLVKLKQFIALPMLVKIHTRHCCSYVSQNSDTELLFLC